MAKLNVLIAGSTGYIGIQLVKLLTKHKYVNIKYLCGNTSVGKKISYYDKSLSNKNLPKIVKFNKLFLKNIDVIFTKSKLEAYNNLIYKNSDIDLSADKVELDLLTRNTKIFMFDNSKVKIIKD